MISPIQIRRHWIRRIVFEPQDDLVKDSKYQAHISLQQEKKTERCWRVLLKVTFGGNPTGQTLHNGEIEFEGIFDIHPEYPEDKIEDLVRMNGGAILYGAVRELILNLTSRCKHGPFEMPTIDARMFLKKPEEKPKAKKISKKI